MASRNPSLVPPFTVCTLYRISTPNFPPPPKYRIIFSFICATPMTRSVTLFCWSHSTTHSRRGRPPTFTNPLGISYVMGLSRRPSPPERITAVLGLLIRFTHGFAFQLQQKAHLQ